MTSYDETEEGQSNKMLNAWELIKKEILSVPALSSTEEQALAMQARGGDEEAREALAAYCVRFAIQRAGKYTQFGYSYDEYHDLIGVANEKLAVVLDTALTKENSVAYIRASMKYGMIEASRYFRQFVNVNLDDVAESLAVEIRFPSTEAAQETAMVTELRKAVGTLTEKQRYVVERLFGLDGEAPEPLRDLNMRLSYGRKSHSLASSHLEKALRRLRKVLK